MYLHPGPVWLHQINMEQQPQSVQEYKVRDFYYDIVYVAMLPMIDVIVLVVIYNCCTNITSSTPRHECVRIHNFSCDHALIVDR
jgi:hypothetical protein